MSAKGTQEDLTKPVAGNEEEFIRMTLQERLQHGVLILTFFLLVLTGLPLVAYEWKPIQLFFLFKFSFYARGIIHRIAASLLIGLSLWHLVYVTCTQRGRETVRALILKRKDFTDAFEILLHNLGTTAWLHRRGIFREFFQQHPYWLFREAPRYGRYNFIEKFEYLAVVWGSFVMILTGFSMWQVELAMEVFPKYVFDVFVTIHSYEAILAFLAIIIWHMYNVHFSPRVFPMNRVFLTGRMSRRQMMEEHPLEYEEIQEKSRKEDSSWKD